MRKLYLLALGLWIDPAWGAVVPELVCQELRVVHVDPRSLEVKQYESRALYRLKSGNLYLSSPESAEYLYNKVIEVEPMRYVSGHKTMLFESPDFRSAVLVHTYGDEVRVSRAICART